jgi:hypothetical protein
VGIGAYITPRLTAISHQPPAQLTPAPSLSRLRLGTDRTENAFPHCCSSTVAVGTYLFAKSLLSNGSCIYAYFAVVAQQRVYILQYFDVFRGVTIDWVRI